MLELTSDQIESIVKEDLHRSADVLESLSKTMVDEGLFKDYCAIIAALDYYGEQRKPSEAFTEFSLSNS
jgi:hypothetical protein